ncbi:HD domain-containing protein [Chryseolinea soli]|uniref:HDIG domain-containing protein n=1 Tax=Chryseolinea soli TaxID=2321403 RepID=A0A385SDH1_9BACT|nr:HDIG domain-containing metalloprotein [Chryseolinea soli]AYB29703.1 HDIG domain-containing protein [Chryseolinea soli]
METTLDPVVEEVLDLYRTYGTVCHRDALSPLEHMLQTAQCAIAAGACNEMVLAAFFHDIGRLCVMPCDLHGHGRKGHEKIGADFLRHCGFPERLARLVEGHVQANRYLSFSCCEYYNTLNEANRKALECQGGPMSRGEARAFEQDPFFQQYVLLCRWDAQATNLNMPLIDWEEIRMRMETALLDHALGRL